MKNMTQTLLQYSHITKKCFINAPYDQLESGLLDFFVQNSLQPEIGLEGECLWNVPHENFQRTADTLRENDLPCTLHAPFFDLAPGGIDSKIREITRDKLRKAFELIPVFRPESIVCHLGYDDNKHSYKLDRWLKHSIETWQELIGIATDNDTLVMFENTYETNPDIHYKLFSETNSPQLRFCLDTGHLTAYAGTPWQLWTDKLLPWLGQLHLHDNQGSRDEHIAIGHGVFNFSELIDFLVQEKRFPLITLEPHSQEDLFLSLENLARTNLLDGITSR